MKRSVNDKILEGNNTLLTNLFATGKYDHDIHSWECQGENISNTRVFELMNENICKGQNF